MKMIITGASGFIGSRLLQAGRAIYGQDMISFASKPMHGSHIVYSDVNNFSLKREELALVESADVLIHAGAYTPKSGADANQMAGCSSNIKFTEKLLALPWTNLKKIIYLSTLDVYTNVDGPISEDTATAPATLYGLSKLYCERMVSLYADERSLANQVLRIGHVYGPGEEKYVKVLPRTIQSIVAGKNVELWGEGTELRSFIYIDDVVTAILNAVELKENPGVINVVSGNVISIRELLKKLINIGGRDTPIARQEFTGITRDLVFDNSKIKKYLLPNEVDFSMGIEAEFKHIKNLIGVNIKQSGI
jgi:UDP-glucose 4-epimerase